MKKEISNISIQINGKEVVFEAKDKNIVCSSLDIAKVFEKKHFHILELINEKLKNEHIKNFTDTNFRVSKYKDNSGRLLPCYKLTRDGFSFVAMGLTGRKADVWKVLFIKAFSQMEMMLREYDEHRFLQSSQKEVFNLIYKTPCRDAILEEVRRQEQEKKAKCVKINQYRIQEIFEDGNIKICTEIQLDFDRPVKYELDKSKITRRQVKPDSCSNLQLGSRK